MSILVEAKRGLKYGYIMVNYTNRYNASIRKVNIMELGWIIMTNMRFNSGRISSNCQSWFCV